MPAASSSAELAQLAERSVGEALEIGAGAAEAYVEDSFGTEIRVFDGEVESLTAAGERGLGLRVWIDGRVGFAYGTELSDPELAKIAAAAVGSARAADSDEHAGPPEPPDAPPAPIPGLADPSLGAWSTERKVELAKAVDAAARAVEEVEAVESTVYADEQASAAIVSSTGIRGAWDATQAFAWLQAIAARGGEKETGLGLGLGRSPEALDAGEIGGEAAARATGQLGAEKPASRTCPVVLDPLVAASFVGFIGSVLCADAAQRGRSPFAGRLGERIGSRQITIADDGTDPDGLASAPVDAEGVPRRRTPLLEAGRLAAYLHDTYTARREGGGASSTASASRAGYRSAPAVSTSNLVVEPGSMTLEELFAEAGEGIYVTDVAGLHSGVNPISGTFSVGASGLVIRDGALAEPASEFTIASDLPAMLEAIAATGSQTRWVPFGGSVHTPAILVAEMAVGGR